VFGFGIMLLSLVTGQFAFKPGKMTGKTSGALHSQKGVRLDLSMQARHRSRPRLEDKPHFKRWGMLGVAAQWA
jgi:hypothetical protein